MPLFAVSAADPLRIGFAASVGWAPIPKPNDAPAEAATDCLMKLRRFSFSDMICLPHNKLGRIALFTIHAELLCPFFLCSQSIPILMKRLEKILQSLLFY
jgi:hypothetical protein